MRIVAVAVGLAGVLSMPGQLRGDEGASRPAAGPGTPREFSDENVRAAIDKGAAYLWSLQKPDGSFPEFAGYPDGPTALIAWALMESGVKPSDKRMEKALAWLEAVRNTQGYVPKTYCMGLRCQAWLAAIRYKGNYRAALRRDAELLIKSGKEGTFHYGATGVPEASWDNSCTYYGHLGIWAPASANLEIPAAYWKKSLAHWMTTQCADGGWAYGGVGARGTAPISAAGVASMYLCFDALYGEAYAGCGGPRAGAAAQASIQRGLAWFDRNFAGTLDAVDGYYLQGVEQMGLASGRKHFGTVDWYKAGTGLLLRTQAANGSWAGGWGGPPVTTAQCMLFLIHGRAPVMFGRLEYAGDWNNRPRALAMLARWMSREILCGGEMSWQIVSVKTDPREWHDAPVLCITGTKKPAFTDEELGRLRTYVGQGGTILSVAECDGGEFEKGMKEIYARLFPEYAIREAPLTHELYRVNQDLSKAGVVFQVVSNGVRPLAIHVSKDLPRAWQTYNVRREKRAFEAALNIYMYATDRTLPVRGSMTWPAEPSAAATDTVKLARVKFAGNWNPEPLAYERFSRLLQERAKVKLEVSHVEAAGLAAGGAQVAVLSGTGELRFGEGERQSLRSFVDAGGTLMIDAAGGDKAFADSAAAMVRQAFGAGGMRRVEMTDPLMTVAKIEAVRYRRRTGVRMRGEEFAMAASPAGAGTGRVIFSSLDITAALVGCPCLGCDGYDPETAYEIMRNVVLSRMFRIGRVACAGATEAMCEDPLRVICHLKSDSAGDLLEAMRRGGVEAELLPEGAHGRGPANRWRAALQVPRRQHAQAVAVLREYLEARPPGPYRPPGARGDPFKVCSTCRHGWPTREAFLGDPKVRLIGYQANFSSLELGLLIFQHDGEHCHTSLAMTVGLFADLYDGPIYAQSQAGSGECMEYCLRQEMLEVCPALCECACVREVVRAIRVWPKRA